MRPPVRAAKGSAHAAAAVRKASVLTMSGHHQGIRELGTDLTVSAVAEDGIVEAIEHNEHPFAVGVQWHPEASAASDADQQRLFDAFVELSARRAAAREAGSNAVHQLGTRAGKAAA